MKGNADSLEGLSIQKSYTNIDKHLLYLGCRMNSLTLNLVQEGFHDATWDFIGKKEETTGEQISLDLAEYPTKNGFTGYEVSVYTDHTGSWQSLAKVTSGNINITNDVESDGYVLGSQYREAAEYGVRNVSGEFSIFFEDLELYDIYSNGTECGIRFVFDNGTDSITFEFPQVKLGGSSPDIPGATGIDLTFTFQARYLDTENPDVKVTIVNSLSSIELQDGE
jgi:hypothetical protein